MNVQRNTSTAVPVSSQVWEPIRIGNSSIGARMRTGRIASRGFANAVMFGLLRESGLPIDLIREAAGWLMVVERETRGRGVGIILRLGVDFDLGLDGHGRELAALFDLKATIDNSGFSNAVEARRRGVSWTSNLFEVEEDLRRKHVAVRAKLPQALSCAIDAKLDELAQGIELAQEVAPAQGIEFAQAIEAKNWAACCSSMAALDRLVSDELGWRCRAQATPADR